MQKVFKLLWVIGVRPNLITWVVGISLRGRGRKNIICPQKERSFIKSSQKKAYSLANHSGNDLFCLYAIVKTQMFPSIIGKKRYPNKLPNSGFCSGQYFIWETCIFKGIYSRKQRYRVVRLLVKANTCKNLYQ